MGGGGGKVQERKRVAVVVCVCHMVKLIKEVCCQHRHICRLRSFVADERWKCVSDVGEGEGLGANCLIRVGLDFYERELIASFK